MKYFICITCITLYLFCGCNRQNTFEKILNEWYGKEIIFPSSLQGKIMGRDTICNDMFTQKYKIIIHVDSTGCSSCKLQLSSWYKYIQSFQEYRNNVSFIIIVHAINLHQMAIITKQNKFNHPIFYDKNGEMDKINKFPNNEKLRCFLVDEYNKVILVGNPLNNSEINKLYYKIISEN